VSRLGPLLSRGKPTNGACFSEYRHTSIVGLYRAFTPILLVRDPEMIKEVTIKSFSHFRDNDIDIDQKVDPMFGKNPFSLKGDEWKVVRAQLTPCFTSGKVNVKLFQLFG
jgi:hypothetical protein